MKIELPCEIVRDLLPNYIDGLASKSSEESVESHLEGCQECMDLYHTMQQKYTEKEINTGEEEDAQQEKVLLKKIRKKINRRVRHAILICIAVFILVTGGAELLVHVPIKRLSPQQVTVSGKVYSLKELLAEVEKQSKDTNNSIIKREDKGDYLLQLKDSPMEQISISQYEIDNCDDFTIISFDSEYFLNEIRWDSQTVNGKKILYITAYRTTVFQNREQQHIQKKVTLLWEKYDSIIYRAKDGTETPLCELLYTD